MVGKVTFMDIINAELNFLLEEARVSGSPYANPTLAFLLNLDQEAVSVRVKMAIDLNHKIKKEELKYKELSIDKG